MNSKTEKYTMEYLLELLSGYQYYSKTQINYIYHNLNGNEEEAKYYLFLFKEEQKPINDAFNKLQNKE